MTELRARRSSHAVDFFQLISWLQRSRTDRAEIGHLGHRGLECGEEALRLRPAMSLAFPVRDVESIERAPATGGRSDRVVVDVNFGGLYGPDAVLPEAFTEYFLQDQGDEGDDKAAVRDFLDIFHHRLYSLLFRAWEKPRYHTTFRPDGSDDISQMLFSLVGLGAEALQDGAGVEGAFDRFRVLRMGALLMQRPRSVAVLHAALREFLGEIPVEVEEFVERRFELPVEDRTHLTWSDGVRIEGGGFATARRLGEDAVLGGRLLDRTSAIAVHVGPLTLDEYEDLLPGTDLRRGLDGLVQRVAPIHLEHDVILRISGSEVPRLRLTGRADVRLGWTSWIRRSTSDDHAVRFPADDDAPQNSPAYASIDSTA